VVDPATLAAFAATSFLIELTPGPNMAYLALIAATEGRQRGFAAVAGVALGLGIVGLAAALGLAALIAGSPVAYQALRWCGVIYIMYLAWEAWRGGEAGERLAEAGSPLSVFFRRGLVTNLLNPKAAVFYISVLPSFLPQTSSLWDTLALSSVYVAVATVIHGGIVVAAGAAQGWLGDERRAGRTRRLMAMGLVGVALWIVAKT
jgi:threonine/homoserine/homoserine lactone efflux protein